jgi:hypothetical protein
VPFAVADAEAVRDILVHQMQVPIIRKVETLCLQALFDDTNENISELTSNSLSEAPSAHVFSAKTCSN